MKKEILNYLRTDRSYKKGVELYLNYGLKMSFKKQLNMQPENDQLKGILMEELRELAGITPQEFRVIMKNPVAVFQKIEQTPRMSPAEEITATIRVMPEAVKKTIRLREEFPFLADKECPSILKLLVHDMITCYEEYKQAHEKLFTAANQEEVLEFARETVENYLENREIWEELNYYKENNELLGKHPLFSQQEKFADLASLSTHELYKKMGNANKAISGLNVKIEKGEKPDKVKEWTDKLEERKAELTEIKRILNINE